MRAKLITDCSNVLFSCPYGSVALLKEFCCSERVFSVVSFSRSALRLGACNASVMTHVTSVDVLGPDYDDPQPEDIDDGQTEQYRQELQESSGMVLCRRARSA